MKRRRTSGRVQPMSAKEVAALRRELARAMKRPKTPRWNPSPDEVQRSVAKLVLTLVELIRQLLEREAIRRMDRGTLTDEEIENVGLAMMRLEKTVRQMAKRFGLKPEELNLDLGPIGRLL